MTENGTEYESVGRRFIDPQQPNSRFVSKKKKARLEGKGQF